MRRGRHSGSRQLADGCALPNKVHGNELRGGWVWMAKHCCRRCNLDALPPVLVLPTAAANNNPHYRTLLWWPAIITDGILAGRVAFWGNSSDVLSAELSSPHSKLSGGREVCQTTKADGLDSFGLMNRPRGDLTAGEKRSRGWNGIAVASQL